MVSQDVIEAMTERIVREFDPVQVILFGSQARGEADSGSDVDLLVVLPQSDNRHEAALAIRGSLSGFHVPVDVIVTTPEEIARRGHLVGTVLRPALREGKVLYQAGDGVGEVVMSEEERRAMDEEERLSATRRWLRMAHADLRAAEVLLSHEELEPNQPCWLSQQAAEKALKAVLVFLQIDLPLTHNLDEVRNVIPPGWQVKLEQPDLKQLSGWAVQARYPGEWADPTPEDAEAAVEQARAIWESLRDDFKQRGLDVLS